VQSIVVFLEVFVGNIGEKLRSIRVRWGLSLREVKERSEKLAKDWGNNSYGISGSWLARLERGKHEMTVPKLITLSTIYSEPAEELLREYQPELTSSGIDICKELTGPNTTQVLTGGQLYAQARQLIPDDFSSNSIPEHTMLLPREDELASSPYRRAIIGRRDRTLAPMIQPGSIVKIDIQKKAILSRKDWTNEFNRPIYLLLTPRGFVCGWCELAEGGMLTVVTHSLSGKPFQHWKYKTEVDVYGRAVAVVMRLTA
jgi:transcriptional regulator with XRE-family HTH domain